MHTQKSTLLSMYRAFGLFLCLVNLPLAAPLQAQVFEESYFSARNPKRTGQVKGFVKTKTNLLLHASAPFNTSSSAEYLASLNPDGQTLWNSFDWPKTAASATYSNLTRGSNNAIYLSSLEDGLYYLLKISATTGAIQWKKPFVSGVSVSRIVERTADELVLLEYDNNNWMRFYATSDGHKIKEIGLSDFVRLETQLHPLLKPETLRLGAASAPCTVHFPEDHRVEFVFPNYHLVPAMADSAAARGFVFFQIHTTPGLDIEDQCLQQAAIYFDYNPPIYTNQASLTITNPSAVYHPGNEPSTKLEIYPNPASSGQMVWIKKPAPEGSGKYQLSDLAGRILLRGNIANGIKLQGIPAGLYCLESGGLRCWLVVD